MKICIDQEFDLSIHMGMVLSLAETIQDALGEVKELKHILFSVWLLKIYLEELNKAFVEHKINIY
jgi:hypothetical protein